MNPTTRKLVSALPLLLVAGLLALMFHTASGAASLQKDPSLSSHILYVDVDATGPPTGTSWYNAYTRLQDAMWYAATLAPTSTVEIWVAEGVYYPDEGAGVTDNNVHSAFMLTNNLELYGGFAGDEMLRSHRDWEVHVTVLSGDLDQNDTTDAHSVVTDTANITGTNAYHVVTGHGVTVTARLDGFSITAGKAIDGGGGMFSLGGSPTLDNLTFSGNDAGDTGGGGMYNNINSNPMLTNVTFSGNSTDGDGGGMTNSGSNPTLDNVNFSGNSARWGGGMSNVASSPTLSNVTFSDNVGGLGGGGMVNTYGSNPTLTDVTFSGNDAGTEGGGGMLNRESSPMLSNVTFSKNSSLWAGGGMYNQESSPTLDNVIFADNFGDVEGGGMRNSSGSNPALSSVTFSGNAADNGGGMYNFESNPALSSVTFSGNAATDEGGGMYNFASSPTLTDVTFSDNTADHGGGMNNESGSNPTLTDVAFSGNAATRDGGGMYNENSSPTLTDVTFSGNEASGEHGGGMHNDKSSPTLDNVIFSGNAADNFGGGMCNYNDSGPILTNVSFSGNAAGNSGGGMFNHTSSPAIRNSILWGNQDSGGTDVYAQIDNYDSTPVISYTLVQDYAAWGIDYDGNLDADPLFVTPVDPNHAPTTEGNLRLQQGSPAIDAGDNSYVTVPTDLDGSARILGTAVDMGAYERLKPLYLPLVIRLWPPPPFR